MNNETENVNDIQLNLVGIECNKETRQLIALAIGGILCTQGIFPAEWCTGAEKKRMTDIQIGTGNNWWLKTYEEGGHLYLQSRYYTGPSWLTNNETIGSPSNRVKAYRIRKLVQSIESITGIVVTLPLGWNEL